MPLLRYDIGDLAEVGRHNGGGRGLPVLNRIIGRSRNLLKMPDGSQHFPDYQDILAGLDHIFQFQIIQKELDRLEMKLVVRRQLNTSEQTELRKWLQDRLMYPFNIDFTYHDHIPRSEGGKYMDFISEVD